MINLKIASHLKLKTSNQQSKIAITMIQNTNVVTKRQVQSINLLIFIFLQVWEVT